MSCKIGFALQPGALFDWKFARKRFVFLRVDSWLTEVTSDLKKEGSKN